ncbi:DUF2334 domain-containing protein [Effusibacillus pohliae]|uniref:DUF2334 domain-containing protein n=1 Tax=Effusibacillus pohliae TaxID=232270 RepID=UPI000365F509|nr:DUF2334 domain-containing protein [Effusibacillus pohliae]
MLVRSETFANMRPALLRLEDVGPGGPYRTLEDLGRLRAVFEYLFAERVPFHVALIPRWKNIESDGSWYEKGIDDPYPDEYLRKLIGLLQTAQKQGALFGMHGYTHQYGNRKMKDDNQDTATGFEFDIKNAPETKTPAYAVQRVTKSWAAFRRAGLYPHFWESPHYTHTRQQERIFELFSRVIYQPDVEGRAATNVFMSETGVFYIPTPLGYIDERNTVERVLSRLEGFDGLASLFYHPFREFPFLERATGQTGKPVFRNGLPVFQYRRDTQSDLQKLIHGFRQRGFDWVPLYYVLPKQRVSPGQSQVVFYPLPFWPRPPVQLLPEPIWPLGAGCLLPQPVVWNTVD